MSSKITCVKKTEKIIPRFTCSSCGSHSCSVLSKEGRVAGRFEKMYICLGCKGVFEAE